MRASFTIARTHAYAMVLVLVSVLTVSLASAAPARSASLACRGGEHGGHIVPYERLSWIDPRETDRRPRLASSQPDARQPGVVVLQFADKLTSAVVVDCGAGHTEWIERVTVDGRNAKVYLRGAGTRWRAEAAEGALLVWNPRAIAQAVSRRWPTASVRLLLDEARRLGIAPDNADELRRLLNTTHQRERGFAAFAAGQFDEAAEALQAVYEALPNDVEAGLALARARYQLADYDQAEELLERLADGAPRSAEIRHEQGLLALSRIHGVGPRGDGGASRADARRHFRAAAQGGWHNASFYLGFLAFQDGEDAESTVALEQFLAGESEGPLTARARRMLAVIEGRSQPPPSAATVRRATVDDPRTEAAADRNNRPVDARNEVEATRSAIAKSLFDGPSLLLQGLNREDLRTSSLVGQPLILHLWATWCPPCRKEMPSLMRFVRERMPAFHAQGLRLVTVSMDYTEEELADVASAWSDEIEGDLPAIYWDPNGLLAERLGLGSALPQTLLVTADGSVHGVRVGAQDWEDDGFATELRSLAVRSQE